MVLNAHCFILVPQGFSPHDLQINVMHLCFGACTNPLITESAGNKDETGPRKEREWGTDCDNTVCLSRKRPGFQLKGVWGNSMESVIEEFLGKM